MKKLLFILLFANTIFAQNDFKCVTNSSDVISDNLLDQFDEINLGPDDNRPYVFKVHYYQVNRDDGTNDNLKTENDFMDATAMLNKVFNQFNIFFKWDNFDYINKTLYYEWQDNGITSPEFYDFVLANNLYIPQSLNIYIFNELEPGIGGSTGQYQNFIPIRILSSLFNHHALAHEVGHNYGLAHTFGNYQQGQENTPGACEHVTRDINDPRFNAFTNGDKLIGTNATPYNASYTDVELDADCNYIGSAVDCDYPNNAPYVAPEFKNIMSYTRLDCYNELKASQGSKMRWVIKNLFLGDLNFLRDTIHRKELYKPYKGEYFVAGPLPVDEGGHLNPPLFQRGFDYEFVDCSEAGIYNEPSPYEDTSFSYSGVVTSYNSDYQNNIQHINHTAIRILQIDTEQPRMCYNNYNKSPSGGAIIKFNDNVLNTNVTITPQDSTSINNINLIQDLQPGLYNVIKNYNDGTQEENLIQKQNNN